MMARRAVRPAARLRIMAAMFASALACNCVMAGDSTWDRNARWLEEQVGHCASGADADACRYFPARALARLFGLTEFCGDDHCMTSLEIAAKVAAGSEWSAVGPASAQKVLSQAQDMAVGGLAVIALQAAGDTALVVLIMPGKLFPSQRWSHGVPIAVGARVDKPELSVYSKGLNFLFSDPTKVTLYAHK